MQDKKIIKKKLEQIIKDYGYKRCASFMLAKETGSIISYFWMEAPTGAVYLWFCVYPVFMPPVDVLQSSIYGSRVSNASPGLGYFPETDDDFVLEQKLKKLNLYIKTVIEPFVQKLADENTLVDTLYQARKNQLLLFHHAKGYKLLMYYALYHQDYSNALKYADEYIEEMKAGGYVESIIKDALQEVQWIKEKIKMKDYNMIEKMLESFCKQNSSNYRL